MFPRSGFCKDWHSLRPSNFYHFPQENTEPHPNNSEPFKTINFLHVLINEWPGTWYWDKLRSDKWIAQIALQTICTWKLNSIFYNHIAYTLASKHFKPCFIQFSLFLLNSLKKIFLKVLVSKYHVFFSILSFPNLAYNGI